MEPESHHPQFAAAQAASRAELDDMISTVMCSGWSHAISFVTALQLRSSGISAAQAREAFRDGLRRIQ